VHDDIDYDTESYFNQFFCITVGTRLAAMMFEREDAQDVAVELESDPRDLHPLLFTDRMEIDATVQIEGGRTLRTVGDEALHPFAHLFGDQPARGLRRRGILQELVERAANSTTTRYELHARTWGDHGELFELPEGWWFQDNMIQNKPSADLIIIVSYDADNLPNPWEWQLHEPAPCSLMDSPWDQVPSTTDKPRAGWAPTLIAAMTRSATAAQLHLYERSVVGGA